MKIYAINTGRLRIRRMHRRGVGFDRYTWLASWLLVPGFAPDIPMRAWLIDHPDGPIVIDTGETIRAQEDPDYFPQSQLPFWKSAFRFTIAAEDEIGPQLRKLGFEPEAIKTVVLTHSHMDHSDGLHHFPNAKVLLSAREWHDTTRNPIHGAVFSQWPEALDVQPVAYKPEPVGPFAESYPLTADGKVRLVPTPGHTMGHQSVVVLDDDLTYFIAGDVSFTEAELYSRRVDGVTHSARASWATRRKVQEWAASTPLVYLPSHDDESETRLANKTPLRGPG